MAVCIEPVAQRVAIRKAEAARTVEVAEEMQRERQGFITTARIRQRQQAAARREEELADGHAEMRFSGNGSSGQPDDDDSREWNQQRDHRGRPRGRQTVIPRARREDEEDPGRDGDWIPSSLPTTIAVSGGR